MRISSTTYPLITSVVSEAGSAETRPRPRHRYCETETRPRHGYPRPRPLKNFTFICVFFSPVEFALTILGSLYCIYLAAASLRPRAETSRHRLVFSKGN